MRRRAKMKAARRAAATEDSIPYDERAAEHVHPAGEAVFAVPVRRELDRDRLADRERLADVEVTEEHLVRAVIFIGTVEGDSRGEPALELEDSRLVAARADGDSDLLHASPDFGTRGGRRVRLDVQHEVNGFDLPVALELRPH